MITLKDIYWVSGILEGEGYFGLTDNQRYPRITLQMTDVDVVRRVKNILDPSRIVLPTKERKDKPDWKRCYRLDVNSHRAVGWMMTIYPLMSKRRQSKIKEILLSWKGIGKVHGTS